MTTASATTFLLLVWLVLGTVLLGGGGGEGSRSSPSRPFLEATTCVHVCTETFKTLALLINTTCRELVGVVLDWLSSSLVVLEDLDQEK